MGPNDMPMRRLIQYRRQPSPDQQDVITDVHDLAIEYASLPEPSRPAFLAEVKRLTNARQRFLATCFTPPDHPAFRPLMMLLDALIDSHGVRMTKHGAILDQDLVAYAGRIVRENGRELIQFPVSVPWRSAPDRAIARPGIPGDPVYRDPSQRKPIIEGPEPAPKRPAGQPWWDD
jgi:hypothetical protein